MCSSGSNEIINIIGNERVNPEDKALLIKNIIKKMDSSEKLQLHAQLTRQALAEVFRLRKELELEYDVIEHIMWQHCLQHIEENEVITDDFLELVIDEYDTNKYMALESVAVALLRQKKLSSEQTEKLTQVYNVQSVKREIESQSSISKINCGELLNADDVERLLELRAYTVLRDALDINAINREGLLMFDCPNKGEVNKKIKEELYYKARSLVIDESGYSQ